MEWRYSSPSRSCEKQPQFCQEGQGSPWCKGNTLFGGRKHLVRNVYYCTICQRTGVVTSILQHNINCQILISLRNICISDTLNLAPKTINETPLPSPVDHNTAVIVTSDDTRDIRIVSRGLLGMHLEWQEDGKKGRWFSLGNALLHCGWQLSTSNHH